MTDFRRRHKRRGNCSSISTLTLVNPWTRKTMEATAPYTTGAVLTKVNHLEIFQRASWPVAQLVGQGGHLHPLPPPWLLVQGVIDSFLFMAWFNLNSLDNRHWYSATGGWRRWSPWCSSFSSTPSNTNFRTSQSVGQYVGYIIGRREGPLGMKLCWRWDHWILDVLICNGGGTVLGIYTLRWDGQNSFFWAGTQVASIENLPLERTLWDSHLQVLLQNQVHAQTQQFHCNVCRGKIKRFFGQFSPHGWIEFQWNPLSSFERYFAICVSNFNRLQVVCNHLPGYRLPHHWAEHVLLEVRIMLANFLVFLNPTN